MSHTPPEVKERRAAELRALEEVEGATSDEVSDSDRDGDAADGKAAPDQASRTRPPETRWLPTPPLSAHSSILTPHGKKRRRPSIGAGG